MFTHILMENIPYKQEIKKQTNQPTHNKHYPLLNKTFRNPRVFMPKKKNKKPIINLKSLEKENKIFLKL